MAEEILDLTAEQQAQAEQLSGVGIDLSPEQETQARQLSGQLDPLLDFTPDQLSELEISDPENFNIRREYLNRPELHKGDVLMRAALANQKVRARYDTPSAVIEVSENLPDLLKPAAPVVEKFIAEQIPVVLRPAVRIAGAGKQLLETAKTVTPGKAAKAVWHFASGLAKYAANSIAGAASPFVPEEARQNYRRLAAENLAASEQQITGFFGDIKAGTHKAAQAAGIAKPFSEYDPTEARELFLADLDREILQEETARGKGPVTRQIGGEVIKELESVGKPVRPEEVAKLTDPFTFYAYAKGFGVAGGLVPAEAKAAASSASRWVGEVGRDITGTALEGIGESARILSKGTTALSKIPAQIIPPSVLPPIVLPLIKRAAKVLPDVSEGVKSVGKQIRTGEFVSPSARLIADITETAPAAIGDIAGGIAFDIGTTAAMAEFPEEEVGGGVGIGTAFGLIGAGRHVTRRVISGQEIAPRVWGGKTQIPTSGPFKGSEFDTLHGTAYQTATPAIKQRVNAVREFLKKAAPGVDLFYVPDKAAFETSLINAGLPAADARLWADQSGVFVKDFNGKRVAFATDIDAAPHESFHPFQDVIGETANNILNQKVKAAYTDAEFEREGMRYASRLGWDGRGDWRDFTLDASGEGYHATIEKLAQEAANIIKLSEGKEATPEEAKEQGVRMFNEAFAEATAANPGIDPNIIRRSVWRGILTEAEQKALADNYAANELAAETWDAVFKHTGPGMKDPKGLIPKFARVAGNLVAMMGGEPLAGRESQIGELPLKRAAVDAVREAVRSKIETPPLIAGEAAIPRTPAKPSPSAPARPGAPVGTPEQEATNTSEVAAAAPEQPTGPEIDAQSPREILGTFAESKATGQGVKITRRTAPGTPAGAIEVSRGKRREQIETARGIPDDQKPLWEKNFTPVKTVVLADGSIQEQGWSPEVLAANAEKTAKFLSDTSPALSPFEIDTAQKTFTADGWRDLFDKVNIFAANQAAGLTGKGTPLVIGRAREFGFFEPTGTREAVGTLTDAEANFINYLFGFPLPGKGSVLKRGGKAQFGKQLITEATEPGRAQPLVEPRTFGSKQAEQLGFAGEQLLEVNPLRAQIEQAGGTPPSLIEVWQNLNLKDIVRADLAPELPAVRPVGVTLGAGFSPKPGEAKFSPKEGEELVRRRRSGSGERSMTQIRQDAEARLARRKEAYKEFTDSETEKYLKLGLPTNWGPDYWAKVGEKLVEDSHIEWFKLVGTEKAVDTANKIASGELTAADWNTNSVVEALLDIHKAVQSSKSWDYLPENEYTKKGWNVGDRQAMINKLSGRWGPEIAEKGLGLKRPDDKSEEKPKRSFFGIKFSPKTDAAKDLEKAGFIFMFSRSGDTTYLDVTKNGNDIGYIDARIRDDRAEIDMIQVEPEYRRQGIGEALLREMSAELKDRGITKVGGYTHLRGIVEKVFGEKPEILDTGEVISTIRPGTKFSPPKEEDNLGKTFDDFVGGFRAAIQEGQPDLAQGFLEKAAGAAKFQRTLARKGDVSEFGDRTIDEEFNAQTKQVQALQKELDVSKKATNIFLDPGLADKVWEAGGKLKQVPSQQSMEGTGFKSNSELVEKYLSRTGHDEPGWYPTFYRADQGEGQWKLTELRLAAQIADGVNPIADINAMSTEMGTTSERQASFRRAIVRHIQDFESIKNERRIGAGYFGKRAPFSQTFRPGPIKFQAKPNDEMAIRSAAVKDETTGRIYESGIHAIAREDAESRGAKGPFTDGFVTNRKLPNNGIEFLNRDESFARAEEINQLPEGQLEMPGGGLESTRFEEVRRFSPSKDRKEIELIGPDGKKYRAMFDGYMDMSLIDLGWVPQITPLQDLPGSKVKGSTTYGPSLEKAGYKLPADLPPAPTETEAGTPEAQFAPRKKKETDPLKFLGTQHGSASKAWILPSGDVKQLGAQWHHDWLSENAEVAAKYKIDVPAFEGTDTEGVREGALKKGFARVNLDNGVLVVEVREKNWRNVRPIIEDLIEKNLDDIDRFRVGLLNETATDLSKTFTAKLFDADNDQAKMDRVYEAFSEEAQREIGRETQFSPKGAKEKKIVLGYPNEISIEKATKSSMWLSPDGTFHDAENFHAGYARVNIVPGLTNIDNVNADASKKHWVRLNGKGDRIEIQGRAVLNAAQRKALKDLSAIHEIPVETDVGRLIFFEKEGAKFAPKREQFEDPETIREALASPGWAVITGTQEAQGKWNTPTNITANKTLEADLQEKGYEYIPVKGTYKGIPQGSDNNFLVLGISTYDAQALGKKYKQESVLTPKGLLYGDGTITPGDMENTMLGAEARKQKFFSTLPNGLSFSVPLDFSKAPYKPVGEQSTLFGGREYESPANFSQAELKQRYPEAIVPSNSKEKIGSDIVNSPLHKQSTDPVNTFADKLIEFVKQYEDNPVYQLGLRWYSDIVPMLKKEFGADAPMMTELLAASSPNEKPDMNFFYAVDALEGFKSGRFDKIVSKFNEGFDLYKSDKWLSWYNRELKAGNIVNPPKEPTPEAFLANWIYKHDLKPKQSNGQLYGFHGRAILEVLAGKWLQQNKGPKVANFVQNLQGTGHEATVDVWLDRSFRRLGYADAKNRWRIMPANGEGVSDADFAFAQKATRAAAERLGILPDALQGGLWFAEKSLWSENGWGRLDLGSYAVEMGKLPLIRQAIKQRLSKTQQRAKVKPMETGELKFSPKRGDKPKLLDEESPSSFRDSPDTSNTDEDDDDENQIDVQPRPTRSY